MNFRSSLAMTIKGLPEKPYLPYCSSYATIARLQIIAGVNIVLTKHYYNLFRLPKHHF
ncbi:MAG: hypothetical protein J6T41_04290 [Neisseriaceae bacterium]|nr:hypothetical protein [Neisseriaceae bacterium]